MNPITSPTVPSSTPKQNSSYINIDPVESPNGKYVALLYFSRTDMHENWTASLNIQPRSRDYYTADSSGKEPIRWSFEVNENDPYIDILTKEINTLGKLRSSSDLTGIITWNDSNNVMALLTPDKVVIFYFDVTSPYSTRLQPADSNSIDYKEALVLKNIETFQQPELGERDNQSYRMFFSGDSKYFYFGPTPKQSIFKLHLASGEITEYQSKFNQYPIPNQSGTAEWKESANLDKTLVLNSDKETKTFAIPGSAQIDYLGNILLSPDLKHACIEWGSSGYWGYEIVTLTPVSKLKSGQQYSFCRKWINENEVIVAERPYHFGGTYFFNYNVISKKELFIDSL
ncbi:hypothetical protein IPM62_03965 [Candidatus Woesebacteria bacterium]|nr:MAG: hypothetical protein IPM62_03965 [Candidatus Woesebacteria bacterium]